MVELTCYLWVNIGQELHNQTRFRQDEGSLGRIGSIGILSVIEKCRNLLPELEFQCRASYHCKRSTYLGSWINSRVPLRFVLQVNLDYLKFRSCSSQSNPCSMSVRTAEKYRCGLHVELAGSVVSSLPVSFYSLVSAVQDDSRGHSKGQSHELSRGFWME